MTAYSVGPGEAFSLASALFWAIAVVLYKRSGESMGPFTLNLVKNLIAVILLTPTLILFSDTSPPPLTADQWWICIVSGVIGLALADTLYFACLYRIGASRTGIVAAMFSPSMIALSALFLGERLNAWQLAGFTAVVSGVVLVARADRSDCAPPKLFQGVALGVLSVFLMAVGIVMVKRILEQFDVLWIVQIRLLAGVAGMLLLMLVMGRTRRVLRQLREPHAWGHIILASVFGSYLSMVCWQAGYKYTMASIASVLNETSSVIIVVLAWAFLGESLTRRKLAGISLTFGGVIIMLSNVA